jgi:hypothetical protein
VPYEEAEVVHRRVAERRAYPIHVSSGVHRVVMRDGGPVLRVAGRGKSGGNLLGGPKPRRCPHVGVEGEQLVLLRCVHAFDRRGQADSAGIKADDVEVLQHIGRERSCEPHREVHSGGAGTARVDEQRTDALRLIGIVDPEQRDRDQGSSGSGVVEGHLNPSTFDGELLPSVLGHSAQIEQSGTVVELQWCRRLRAGCTRGGPGWRDHSIST